MNLTEKEAEGPGDMLDTASNAKLISTNQTMLITGPWKKKRRLVDESVDKVQPGTDHWIEVEEEEEEEEDDTVNIEGEATENGGVEYVEEEDRNAFKWWWRRRW